MPIEIRIVTGARAGQSQRFDQAVVLVGRIATADLRFDPQHDLDVSGRHAEIRAVAGGHEVVDLGSTNGTYVNGARIASGEGAARMLADGDTVLFGAKGPQAEIHLLPASAAGSRSTEQRIAIAVKKETAGLRRYTTAAVLVALLGVAGALFAARRESGRQVEELRQMLRMNDSLRVILAGGMRQPGDSALLNTIQRKVAELQQRLPLATDAAERQQIAAEIEQNQAQLRRMVQMDLPAIRTRNAPAVVILISEIAGRASAGTGFSITSSGLLVTNRHNVQDPEGRLPSRIAVKFTDTRDWLPARLVSVSDGPDADLALLQVEREGPFPAVEGISAGAGESEEGMSVVTIGYPSGYDTPMEGTGNDFEAKSTLSPGTVSKKTSLVLQIDSYATHGSSGSPVFSARGLVIGVVYGGQSEAGGKIVYAVPPERLSAFIPDSLKGRVLK